MARKTKKIRRKLTMVKKFRRKSTMRKKLKMGGVKKSLELPSRKSARHASSEPPNYSEVSLRKKVWNDAETEKNKRDTQKDIKRRSNMTKKNSKPKKKYTWSNISDEQREKYRAATRRNFRDRILFTRKMDRRRQDPVAIQDIKNIVDITRMRSKKPVTRPIYEGYELHRRTAPVGTNYYEEELKKRIRNTGAETSEDIAAVETDLMLDHINEGMEETV